MKNTITPICNLTAAITGPEDKVFSDMEERISATKKEGESDMDYFERRYQERVRILNFIFHDFKLSCILRKKKLESST